MIVFSTIYRMRLRQIVSNKLDDLYERKTTGNKAFLIRKIVILKYKEEDSITQHLNETQSIMNQLTFMKMILDNKLQSLLLLSLLPDSWETSVVSLSNSAPDGIISVSQFTNSLLNEELRGESHWIPLILIPLLMRTEEEVEASISKQKQIKRTIKAKERFFSITTMAGIDI